MFEFYGASNNLMQKYNKLINEENYKNDSQNESFIINKKFGSSLVKLINKSYNKFFINIGINF